MTRTIRITLQFDIDEANCSLYSPVENQNSLGVIASQWWAAQNDLMRFQGDTRCSCVEIIGIEEPKADRWSAAFKRSLKKKRDTVSKILTAD